MKAYLAAAALVAILAGCAFFDDGGFMTVLDCRRVYAGQVMPEDITARCMAAAHRRGNDG